MQLSLIIMKNKFHNLDIDSETLLPASSYFSSHYITYTCRRTVNDIFFNLVLF